ncbi:unnamed protein product [Ambrosiozyma monospora]|uniref:Unnamed protein product n=1 Tax=Ambrosiozyma monospora TaxID=43982 RepID=A0ACB5SZ58_AMBMO|nr:unnamed protein product [Ambrosiozyma monospora]
MSIDPTQITSTTINSGTVTPKETQQEIKSAISHYIDSDPDSLKQRLGIPAPARVLLFATAGFLAGGLGGMLVGYKSAGLRFLASNSHRLPKSFNGWYMYHKRKGYFCLKESMILGFKTGCKTGGFTMLLFGLEAGLDEMRNKLSSYGTTKDEGSKWDFTDTMMASCLSGFLYAWVHGLNKVQSKDLIKKGGKAGLLFGLSQDLLQFVRGADVWYLSVFGVVPMKLKDRILGPDYQKQSQENV